jgi:hypothetical protein
MRLLMNLADMPPRKAKFASKPPAIVSVPALNTRSKSSQLPPSPLRPSVICVSSSSSAASSSHRQSPSSSSFVLQPSSVGASSGFSAHPGAGSYSDTQKRRRRSSTSRRPSSSSGNPGSPAYPGAGTTPRSGTDSDVSIAPNKGHRFSPHSGSSEDSRNGVGNSTGFDLIQPGPSTNQRRIHHYFTPSRQHAPTPDAESALLTPPATQRRPSRKTRSSLLPTEPIPFQIEANEHQNEDAYMILEDSNDQVMAGDRTDRTFQVPDPWVGGHVQCQVFPSLAPHEALQAVKLFIGTPEATAVSYHYSAHLFQPH